MVTLHDAGFEAYMVGGCVRDFVLSRTPKDLDITTNATPEQVQALFPKTLPVGAAFGVIIAMIRDCDDPTIEHQIEVATYRTDGQYSDGRRPDSVEYGTSAKEDVERRDFTINGMLCTNNGEIIDYVRGQKDCDDKIVRCIGDPEARFNEDALRMLRAVRFAAQLGFEIENHTFQAIQANAPKIKQISRERVAMELTKLLTAPFPVKGLVPLFTSGLAFYVFPYQFMESLLFGRTLRRFEEFQTKDPVLAMTMFLADVTNAKVPMLMCQDLKLSNDDKQKIVTALLYAETIKKTRHYQFAPSAIKRIMRQPGIENALDIVVQDELIGVTNIGYEALMSVVQDYRKLERDEIYPKPLVTGDDLIAAGLKPSPMFRDVLYAVETEQLDGVLTDHNTALARALALAASPPWSSA